MSVRKSELTTILVALLAVYIAACACAAKPALRFGTDGSFKIVQFTDTQDNQDIDPRTVAAMNKILDAQKPNFVVITGDCVYTQDCKTLNDLKCAIENIAKPMETRGIPWAVTFGNHDQDNLSALGITKDEMLGLYMGYDHNINQRSTPGVFGSGNANLLISSSKSDTPAFGIWLIDSNAYAPKEIGGENYDWIRFSQIKWYWETSEALEKRLHRKLPSIMFFHIPICEFLNITVSEKTVGELNGRPMASPINSGLFAAVLERGDVKGIFVGHNHENTIVGERYGIKLGFSGNIGYSPYGLNSKDENERNRLRGARVFTIDERNPADFKTFYLTAADVKDNGARINPRPAF